MRSSTAHHLSMVLSIGFAVASGWAGSSIITVARRVETRRPVRRLGSMLGQYATKSGVSTHLVTDIAVGGVDLNEEKESFLVAVLEEGLPTSCPDVRRVDRDRASDRAWLIRIHLHLYELVFPATHVLCELGANVPESHSLVHPTPALVPGPHL
jgi:hypothetical protein